MVRGATCSTRSLWLVGLLGLAVTIAQAQQPSAIASAPLMPEEGRVVYRPVPDILLHTSSRGAVRLSELWVQKPLIVTLVFSRCAGICSPFLRSLAAASEQVGMAGDDYYIVVLSFDPNDTLEDMAAIARVAGAERRSGWIFAVSSPEEVKRLAQATTFWFRKVEGTGQYDHPAMLIGVREGRVLRLLVGASVSPRALRLVVRALQGELVLSYALPDPRIPFRCFGYDPTTGRPRLDWGVLILTSPLLMTLLVVTGLFTVVRPGCSTSKG